MANEDNGNTLFYLKRHSPGIPIVQADTYQIDNFLKTQFQQKELEALQNKGTGELGLVSFSYQNIEYGFALPKRIDEEPINRYFIPINSLEYQRAHLGLDICLKTQYLKEKITENYRQKHIVDQSYKIYW